MKELKYRVFDKDDGMLYPEFTFIDMNGFSSHTCYGKISVSFFQESHDGNGKYHEDPDPNVEELIWMDFTGFKDKNGKDIYYGDILRYGIYKINVKLEIITEDFIADLIHYGWDCEDNIIVGNIYENKNLIK